MTLETSAQVPQASSDQDAVSSIAKPKAGIIRPSVLVELEQAGLPVPSEPTQKEPFSRSFGRRLADIKVAAPLSLLVSSWIPVFSLHATQTGFAFLCAIFYLQVFLSYTCIRMLGKYLYRHAHIALMSRNPIEAAYQEAPRLPPNCPLCGARDSVSHNGSSSICSQCLTKRALPSQPARSASSQMLRAKSLVRHGSLMLQGRRWDLASRGDAFLRPLTHMMGPVLLLVLPTIIYCVMKSKALTLSLLWPYPLLLVIPFLLGWVLVQARITWTNRRLRGLLLARRPKALLQADELAQWYQQHWVGPHLPRPPNWDRHSYGIEIEVPHGAMLLEIQSCAVTSLSHACFSYAWPFRIELMPDQDGLVPIDKLFAALPKPHHEDAKAAQTLLWYVRKKGWTLCYHIGGIVAFAPHTMSSRRIDTEVNIKARMHLRKIEMCIRAMMLLVQVEQARSQQAGYAARWMPSQEEDLQASKRPVCHTCYLPYPEIRGLRFNFCLRCPSPRVMKKLPMAS